MDEILHLINEMSPYLLLGFLLAGLMHCHCHEHEQTNNNTTMNVNIYHVEGMNCNHCRAAAEKALLNTPGVTSASVDLASKEARVEGTATFDQLKESIEGVGFSLVK